MHHRTSDLAGLRFGRLVVIGLGGKDRKQNRLWVCRCDCGNFTEVRGGSLKDGYTHSCGCLFSERKSAEMQLRATRHGYTGTRTYKTWQAMIARCLNPKSSKFHRYGGRGIKVCARWLSFDNFLLDMGVRPHNCTLDRYPDRKGNYEPGNCRWATPSQQQRNRDKGLHLVTFNGKTLCLTDWARQTGIPRECLYTRINRNGWPPELALTMPARTRLITARKSGVIPTAS